MEKKIRYDGFPFSENSSWRAPQDRRSTKEVVKYGTTGDTGKVSPPTFGANCFTGDLCPEDIFQDKYYSKYGSLLRDTGE